MAPQPIRNKPGRPSQLGPDAAGAYVTLPADVYGFCCREAAARGVGLAVIIREAVIESRRKRGEIRI
jgi:hypothetical protein